MAKNESSKSKAEIYREERKARIAKAAKQNAKSIEKRGTAARIIKKVIAIVLVVAIVGFVGYKAIDSSGLIDRMVTAVKVGDTKISAAEFNYYYSVAYNNIASQASSYESYYGYDVLGFDSSVAPDEQTSTYTDDDGNKLLWSDVIRQNAVSIAQSVIACYNEALAADTELTEDQEAEIKETVETYRTQAAESNYSLNAYLKMYFGPGFNEKSFTEQLKMEMLAENFSADKEEELNATITDEVVNKEYAENSKNYDYADIRFYKFAFTTLTAKDGESDEALKARQKEANDKIIAEAKEVYAKVTDEASLIEAAKAYKESKDDVTTEQTAAKYSELSSSVSAAGADWAFGKDRKAGDKTLITGESAAYIIVCLKPAYTSNSVSVRHCLVEFEAEDAENVTDAEKKAANKKANDLLASLGDKITEDAFAAMAKENSTDTGSVENGGLYEEVRLGQMVENFENWCFDKARKPGDTGIVETEYGYHIMYFVSNNTDDLDWKAAIKEAKGSEANSAFQEELLAEDGKYAVTENDTWTNNVSKDYCDTIRKNLAYSQMYS